MKSKILLNWLPPASVNIPSPAMSVLKSFLVEHGHEVCVKYWNLDLFKLQTEFIWTNDLGNNDLMSLYIFYNYLSIKENDKKAKAHLKLHLQELKPYYLNAGIDFFENHMIEYYEKFNIELDKHLSQINFSEILYWGLSVNLYQWVASSILAKKIKQKDPSQIIVIGGIGTKESAIAFLENFPQFDIALWGEGEDSLLKLSNEIKSKKNNIDFSNIPNAAYRKNESIRVTGVPNRNYIDLSSISIRPNFTDYFQNIDSNNINTEIYIPIENSRSCHWKKCKFCYLNNGYKYRIKSIDAIIDEIIYNIETYQIYNFGFLDNDIIGLDLDRFSSLLDSLIMLRKKYPEFTVVIAEIITKNINADIIRKMTFAGFKHVQIGYESLSNTLLKKINKKNTLASNLLFIKFARQYNIYISGANVLRNLLEETDNDIFESIENLHYLRFFLENKYFQHNMSMLGVIYSSRYYTEIENDLDSWNQNLMKTLLPERYVQAEYRTKIIEVFKPIANQLWERFEKMEKFYLHNKYDYNIFKTDNYILYRELFNNEIINTLEFENESIDIKILNYSNKKVISLNSILSLLEEEGIKHTQQEVIEELKALQKERIIYVSDDFENIVSLINIDLTN